MIVYRAHCLKTNKDYIGVTKHSLKWRIAAHVKDAMWNKDRHVAFHCAIRKYGPQNFKWEIIDTVIFTELMFEMEKYYIKKFKSLSPLGYNVTTGGIGFNGRHTESTKQKIRTKRIGIPRSEETKRKISNSKKGGCFSDSHRMKLSEARRKRKMPPMSEDQKRKLSKAIKGKPQRGTPYWTGKTRPHDTRLAISNSLSGEKNPNFGKHMSNETKRKLSESQKGRVFSEEHKRKLVEAWKLRRLRPKGSQIL